VKDGGAPLSARSFSRKMYRGLSKCNFDLSLLWFNTLTEYPFHVASDDNQIDDIKCTVNNHGREIIRIISGTSKIPRFV